MGIRDFSKDMFRTGLKDSCSYIASVAFTTLVIFLCINVSENRVLYAINSNEIVTLSRFVNNSEEIGYRTFNIPVSDLQSEMMMITIMIIACFTFIASRSFVRKRTNELAFIIMNGANTAEMSYYLRYTCSRVFILGGIIGMGLSVIVIPIFNLLMYKLIGIDGNIFIYNSETFTIGAAFLVINYFFIMVTSTSTIYKKEIIEVINDVNTKKSKDTRQFKFPSIVYLIIYFMPLGILFTPKQTGDLSGFIVIGVYLSVVASLGVVLMYIPKHINFLNGLSFMEHKSRKIYINNSLMKLKDSAIYILGAGLTINYFMDKIIAFKDYKGLIVVGLMSMVLASMIIAVCLISKILDEGGISKKFYKILSAMGYTVEELKKISGLEIITTIVSVSIITFLPISFALIMHFRNGTLENSLIFIIASITLLPIILCGTVAYFINKKKVDIFLEVEIENKKSILDENTKKVFSFIDKISDFIITGFENLKKLWEKEIF